MDANKMITLDYICDNGEAIQQLPDCFATLYKMEDGRQFAVCYSNMIYPVEGWELLEQLSKTEDDAEIVDITIKLSKMQIA